VDLLVDALETIAQYSAKPEGRTGRMRIATTTPARTFLLDLDEQVTLSPWDGGEASTEVALPAEAWIRTVYGRLDAGTIPEVSAAGDLTVNDIRDIFTGV
jgi:hypothetical protein